MKPEEELVVGIMLLLFGISWIGFAAVQPIPVYTSCYNPLSGFSFGSGMPICGTPSPVALLYYAFGIVGVIIGLTLLALRMRNRG